MPERSLGEFLQAVNRLDIPVIDVDGGLNDIKASDIPMAAFATKLASNKTVTSLTLDKTKHTTKHAELLAEGLSKNTVLQSLKLSDLKILDDGVSALAAALRLNSSLTSLSLSMVGMSAISVKELASALAVNSSLKHLDLDGNGGGLTDAGVKSLGHLLGTNQSSLTSLNIGNSHVGPAGIVHLAEGLAMNTTLTTLDMNYLRKIAFSSGKSLDSFAALCAALVRNSTLTSINMSMIQLGQEAMQFLDASLTMNDSLRELEIGDASPSGSERSLMAKVRKPRKKTDDMATCDMPPSIVTWLNKWAAGSSETDAPSASADSSAPLKKRKRMTEAERLRAE